MGLDHILELDGQTHLTDELHAAGGLPAAFSVLSEVVDKNDAR